MFDKPTIPCAFLSTILYNFFSSLYDCYKNINLWFLMPFVICFLFPLFFSSVLLPSQPKHRCYDVKINKDCACIKNCCNKRSRHDCRIKSDLLCQKRKDTPDTLCHHYNCDHCNSKGNCQHNVTIIHNTDSYPVHKRKKSSDNKRHSDLFKDNFKNIRKLNFADRK